MALVYASIEFQNWAHYVFTYTCGRIIDSTEILSYVFFNFCDHSCIKRLLIVEKHSGGGAVSHIKKLTNHQTFNTNCLPSSRLRIDRNYF